jgi:hypothetical protein
MYCGQWDRAEKYGHEIGFDDKTIYMRIAEYRLSEDNKEGAIKYYSKAGLSEKEACIAIAEHFAKESRDSSYHHAALWFEEAGEKRRARWYFSEQAKRWVKKGEAGAAGFCYKKIGKMKEAREQYLKAAEKGIKDKRMPNEIAEFYLEAGEAEKAKEWAFKAKMHYTDWLKRSAEKQKDKLNDIEVAKTWLERADNLCNKLDVKEGESAKLMLSIARSSIERKDYDNAIYCYRRTKSSLLSIPAEEREKLLVAVKEGCVNVIQGLAGLVQTEEEELMFNEARVGLVL